MASSPWGEILLSLPSSPQVMLSPNATIRVIERRGAAWTRTSKLQLELRCRASTASHVTLVVPTGNSAPLAGMHVAVTGANPPVVDGAPNWIATDCPAEVVGVGAAGHNMLGPFEEGSTGVGLDGLDELPHPTAPVTNARNPRPANERLMDKRTKDSAVARRSGQSGPPRHSPR